MDVWLLDKETVTVYFGSTPERIVYYPPIEPEYTPLVLYTSKNLFFGDLDEKMDMKYLEEITKRVYYRYLRLNLTHRRSSLEDRLITHVEHRWGKFWHLLDVEVCQLLNSREEQLKEYKIRFRQGLKKDKKLFELITEIGSEVTGLEVELRKRGIKENGTRI